MLSVPSRSGYSIKTQQVDLAATANEPSGRHRDPVTSSDSSIPAEPEEDLSEGDANASERVAQDDDEDMRESLAFEYPEILVERATCSSIRLILPKSHIEFLGSIWVTGSLLAYTIAQPDQRERMRFGKKPR